MSPDENLGKRIIGSFALGVLVGFADYVLDVSFVRLHVVPVTTVLNDLIADNLVAREHLHRALQLVRGSSTEMRCALWNLYPEELHKVDLKSAIESLVKDLTAGNSLTVQFSLDGMIRQLPSETEQVLLRVSQEALSNVVKHAQARQVRIELFLDSQRARLSVKDDGQGFQPELNPGSFGLTSMRDRTKSLGGVWTIQSEPGRGTEVHASIPIPPAMN